MINVVKKFKSYSLMEVLVACAIIVSVVLGVTLLNNASVRNTSQTKHRLQIALFAQEQMELLRNIRDSAINLNTSEGWNQFFRPSPTNNFCNNGNAFRLIYDDADNRYLLRETDRDDPPEITEEGSPFSFNYYLECGEVSRIDILIGTDPSQRFNDRKRPIRFRTVIHWNEFGQERVYSLNNYLTDLGTEI
ncbi:MAG: hypothetical protein ABH837_00680 [bacterium]